ncbi:chalcone isomerase family protein [Vibrio sp. WJH972]
MLKLSILVLVGMLHSPIVNSTTQEITNIWQKWPSIGQADFNVFFFDVYQSVLKSKSGEFNPFETLAKQRLALVIRYERAISNLEFTNATTKQWKKLKYEKEFITQWERKLPQLFPSVVEGDELVFVTLSNDKSVMLFKPHNQDGWQTLHWFEDREFTERFLSIWLAENSQYPKLRKQLIGKQP